MSRRNYLPSDKTSEDFTGDDVNERWKQDIEEYSYYHLYHAFRVAFEVYNASTDRNTGMMDYILLELKNRLSPNNNIPDHTTEDEGRNEETNVDYWRMFTSRQVTDTPRARAGMHLPVLCPSDGL